MPYSTPGFPATEEFATVAPPPTSRRLLAVAGSSCTATTCLAGMRNSVSFAVPRGGNLVLIRPADRGVFDGSFTRDGVTVVRRPQLYVDLKRRGGSAELWRRWTLATTRHRSLRPSA